VFKTDHLTRNRNYGNLWNHSLLPRAGYPTGSEYE
jgi:hypothetical protein